MRRELVASLAARLAPEDVLVLPDPVYQGGTVTRAVTSADIVADLAAKGATALHIAARQAAAAHLVVEANTGDRIAAMGPRDAPLGVRASSLHASRRSHASARMGSTVWRARGRRSEEHR